MADESVVVGKRRFQCLSPTVVRLEYAPDGVFEDRPSLVAAGGAEPRPFERVERSEEGTLLDTGAITIDARQAERSFNRMNLELRWVDRGLLQYFRPGDRDPRNLGGTLRSLDRYGANACVHGVHTADRESPDAKAMEWIAWLQCEADPAYYRASPAPPEKPGAGNYHRLAQEGDSEGKVLERTVNATADAQSYGPGIVSRSGYFFLNDSESPLLGADGFPVERHHPGHQDYYFFAYGRDLKQALRDWALVSGAAPLLPRHAYGIMFSRWPAFDEKEGLELIEKFAERGHPLSVAILDMEWHKEGWGHWEIDDEILPDPERFFRRVHEHGALVAFNDHPLDLRSDDRHFEPYLERAGTRDRVRKIAYNGKTVDAVDVDICAKREAQSFVDVAHKPILARGLDFWWNDGCRGTMAGASGQLVANKLFFEESERDGRRGMLLARYGGLGSHRYGAFFTGDAASCWPILRTQCEFNIRCGLVGQGHVSHDIGGFMAAGNLDRSGEVVRVQPELYLRWLQFGVLGPVLRFHSAPNAGSRKPWDYDPDVDDAAREWCRFRNSLLPYIYTVGRIQHETGIPMVRGLFLERPEDPAAYRFDEYYLGPDLLVAPVLTEGARERGVYLPEGRWYRFGGTQLLEGGEERTVPAPLEEAPLFARAGAVIPRQDPERPLHAAQIDPLWLELYPGSSGETVLYEDDGASAKYKAEGFCKTRFSVVDDGNALTIAASLAGGGPFAANRAVIVDLPIAQIGAARLEGAEGEVTAEAGPRQGWSRIRLPRVPAAGPWARGGASGLRDSRKTALLTPDTPPRPRRVRIGPLGALGGTAQALYSDDHDAVNPFSLGINKGGWPDAVEPYLNHDPAPSAFGDAAKRHQAAGYCPGYTFAKDELGHQPTPDGNTGEIPTAEVGYSQNLLTSYRPSTGLNDKWASHDAKTYEFKKPHKLMLLGEAYSAAGQSIIAWDDFYYNPRHQGKAPLLYADGHAAPIEHDPTRTNPCNYVTICNVSCHTYFTFGLWNYDPDPKPSCN